MSDCLAKFSADPDLRSLINRKLINSLITDNYTVLIIFVILFVFIVLIIFYFSSHLRTVLSEYRKYNRKLELAPAPSNNQYDPDADNERYDKDEPGEKGDLRLYNTQIRDDPMDYINKGKKDFIADVKTKYGDYNELKSQYIKTTYKKDNDDVIDDNIMFGKHDDYEYSKKPENDDY